MASIDAVVPKAPAIVWDGPRLKDWQIAVAGLAVLMAITLRSGEYARRVRRDQVEIAPWVPHDADTL